MKFERKNVRAPLLGPCCDCIDVSAPPLKAKGDPGLTPGTDELDCEIPGSDVTTISAAMSDAVSAAMCVC